MDIDKKGTILPILIIFSLSQNDSIFPSYEDSQNWFC